MITHRCKGSLKHGVSIRFCKKLSPWEIPGDYKTWRLFKHTIDSEAWNNDGYLEHISEIDYCPFCGEKLIEPEE